MIDKEIIKKASNLLFPEIVNNRYMTGEIEYRLLCEAQGSLKVLLQKLEKK